jgi:hypothetical protein
MTNKEESNERWNPFAESALLSLASPVAPRRSGNAVAVRLPWLDLPLDEEDSFNFGRVRSSRLSRSLSPSTSNRGMKKELDPDSDRTMETLSTSFSTFGLAAPYRSPPRKPYRKPSGDGLVRPAAVSDAEKKRSSVSNNSSEEEYEEEEDFFLDLNDRQSSKKEDSSIRRFGRSGAPVHAFSDSELSEASTINSGGENHKAAARARKQKPKELQEAGRGKIQMEKEKRRGKELEEDDLVDTDMDVAGFTGLAKSRSKSLEDIFETLVSPVGKSSPRSTPSRSRNSGRKGSLEKTSNHSKGSPKSRRNRKETSVGTKNRSNRRNTSSSEESSSEEEDAVTPPRRGKKPSKRRPRIDGERNGSAGRRKGRRPLPPSPTEVTNEGSLHFSQRLIIDVTHQDIVSPCTVASRSLREPLSAASAASKMGSIRSKSTISSRMSGLTFTTGCSSISSGGFDDDFSKLSVQSNETIKSEQQSQTSERRFPGSLATLQELQESSMTSFTSLKKTPTSRAENVSKSSRFMPHQPQRFPSLPKTSLSDCEDFSIEEKAIPMPNSSSYLMKEVKRPTHLLKKATSQRGMTKSSSDLMKEVKRPTLQKATSQRGMTKSSADRMKEVKRPTLQKATSQRGMTKSSADRMKEVKGPTHLFQKATSQRGMTQSSSDLMKEVKRPTLQKATSKRGMTQSSSDLMKEVNRPTHLLQKATSKRGRKKLIVDA